MKKIYLLLVSIFLLGASQTNAQQCTADFQYFTSTNSLTVQFYDSSFTVNPNTPLHYYWSFGDGNNSNATNPSHTYAQSGTYYVCLTIVDTLTNCLDSACYNVTVNAQSIPCTAGFNYYSDSNNVVTFNNITTPSTGMTYTWQFGDGSPNSNLENPVHAYAASGPYTVVLTATGNGSTCTIVDTIFVNYCYAYWTSQVGSNGTVNFQNLSAAPPYGVGYTWDFGDGNSSSSYDATHTYAASGLYNVTLHLADTFHGCYSTYTDSVIVQTNPTGCNASYSIAKDSSVAFGVILYNTSSNYNSHSYSWDFGDGTTGSGRTPIHQYTSFGSYVVCLTITDSILNCTSTFCDTVGMDTLGNLKAGFGLEVRNPISVGIDEVNTMENISIFPNPARDVISIDLRPLTETLTFRILDLTGKVVFEKQNQLAGNIQKVDVSNLNSGLYFILLDNGTTQKIEKFIKD